MLRRDKVSVAGIIALLLGVLSAGAAAVPLRLYVDRAGGVSFTYPTSWLLNADDDAATAKLRIVSEGQPAAVVQLEGNFAGAGPYRGTDFEAGAFAYVIVPGQTEAHCFATLDRLAEDAQKPIFVTWSGRPARRLDTTYTVAGTDDTHRLLATYSGGRCLLFETVIVSKTIGDGVQPLAPARWRSIRTQFDSVLQSVRIAPLAKR